ncbi:MAG: SGNH/GDSL hydrolase family protein, partial [Tissierellia bacterium]|nr:SGNH/GDSL hydrolase family protein [Tissierellia bacterium]
EALKWIDKGLIMDTQSIDLLYNKAYLLEQIKEYKESYILYQKVLNNTREQSIKNDIKERLKKIKDMDCLVDLNGKLSLLVIDKRVDVDIRNFILHWFHEYGFTILKNINTNKIKQYVIIYDLNPQDMTREAKIEYPGIDNGRYFLIGALQKQILIQFGIKDINNYLYLTQNELEAKKIVKQLFKDKIKELYEKIYDIEETYKTQYPVIKLFDGFKHRAKTELIHYRDGLAVKKTWKPGNKRFLEREKYACSELSKTISYIPPLLESGENYIIIPYYGEALQKNEKAKKMILTNHIVGIANFFKQLYEAGYYNPDIHPGQFVFSKIEGLKAIDFEYLQSYEKKPDSFIESYDIQGYPKDFKGDKPNYTGENLHEWYNDLWIQYTGYNLEQIANLVVRGKYYDDDPEINKVLGLLNYAKTSGKSYDGSLYGSAYHSLRLKGYYFRGQREPNLRLQKVPYDFTDKVVLDIGCNAGGMLHVLANKIKMGIGIDYDYRLINAANAIKKINNNNNLSFYRFDLENEELDLIKNYILSKDGKIDICFLLSVCMWIKNWKDVVAFVASISNSLLFETNGTQQQQLEQMEELEKNYNYIEVVEEESNDDPGQPNRRLLFCKNERNKNYIVVENNIIEYNNLLNTIIKPEHCIIYRQNTSSDDICKIYKKYNKDNAMNFNKYMKNFFDVEFYRNYFNLLNSKDRVKGFITGLSYFEVGIDTNKLKLPLVNLSLSSQDLFYDFAMLKYAINSIDDLKNVKYVILGLSNYSFRYDLSKTQNPETKRKPKVYYPLLKDLHNYKSKNKVIYEYELLKENINYFFQDNYLFKIFEYKKDKFNILWDKMMNRVFEPKRLSKEERKREIYLAQRWSQVYPDTKKENIMIFRELLQYLQDKEVKITIVTNPVTNFYKTYFPLNCREEFIDIISEFQKEFKFTFIDAYNMDSFNDSDFYDSSHLNRSGAKKFTEIINEYL